MTTRYSGSDRALLDEFERMTLEIKQLREAGNAMRDSAANDDTPGLIEAIEQWDKVRGVVKP